MLNSLGAVAALGFALLVQDTQADREQKIRAHLEILLKAMTDNDAETIGRCFDPRRMARELFSRRADAPAAKPEEEERLAGVLEKVLPKLAIQTNSVGASWKRVRLLSFRFDPNGAEAEVLCRLTLGESRSKIRFWLNQTEGQWRIYDFEMPDENLRLSVLAGALSTDFKADPQGRALMAKSLMAFQRAATQLGEGDADAALKTLRKAIDAGPPPMILAWLELAHVETLSALGEYADAAKAADRVLALQKDLHSAHALKASALFELEKYEESIASAREFLKKAGDDPDVWLLVGNAHDKLGRAEKAIEAYRKGVASDEEDFNNRLQLGRLLVAAGKAGEAKGFLRDAARLEPEDGDVFGQAAELLDGAGEFGAVLELAEDRSKRVPDDTTALVWRGRSLRSLKRPADAEALLRAALEKKKDDLELSSELVLALAADGKDKEAMERAEALYAEGTLRTHYLRAAVHAAAGRTEQSLDELAKYLNVLNLEHEAVLKEPAFEALRSHERFKSLIAAARTTGAFFSRVAGLKKERKWDELLAMAKERARVAPENPWGFYYQGEALRRLGRPAEAEAALRSILSKTRDPRDYQDELGRALAAQGKVEEALALADVLIANPKAEGVGLSLRVTIHVMTKKRDLALKALETLLDRYPDWTDYWDEDDADLEEFLKLEAVQTLIKKAKKDP